MTMKSTMMAVSAAAVALAGCSTMGGPSRDELVTEPSACSAKRFDIYFAEDQAQLTDAARTAIGLTATQLKDCRIDTVRVLASGTGSADANQALSEQRAVAVAEALVAAGWPTPAFELEAAGAQGATTASGVAEPLRRRTEVLVEAAPR